MTDSRKITLWFFVGLAVLSVAAFIRVRVWPPEPDSADRVVSHYSSNPECAALERALDARFARDNTAEGSGSNIFLKKYEAIEKSDLPSAEKEIRLRRLVESSDITDAKRDADSDVAFAAFMQNMKNAGCLEKK